ncbi:MAG: hypothetical protein IJA03_08050 [Bacteroidaceae bacterium]|nr:hypothetical protein [Bacteroidaceae bacterium]
MNKKLFFGMFAAASMLLATSCSNDELNEVQSGNEAKVTFSLGLENGIGSRTISDGTKADKLVYAVYKLNAQGEPELQNVVGSTNGQFVKTDFKSGDNVSITLAKGQTYQVAFWAQDGDCKAYDTDDLTAVEVKYQNEDGTNAVNNDELRDAFFKMVEFEVAGDKTIDVVLKRPFAQINVGVDAEDWAAALASGIEIEKSAVVVKNAANTINLLTGAVSGNETVVTYASEVIPNETLYVDTDVTKDGKETYNWLSMSYILVADADETDVDNDGTVGDARTTLNSLQFTFSPKSGNDIVFNQGLNNVPVQRNWRTNILGKILTGDIQFNITIDPAYDGDIIYPEYEGTFAELELAASMGGTVTLDESFTMPEERPFLQVSADFILNINENVDFTTGSVTDYGIIVANGTTTINGEGNIKSQGGGVGIKNGASLVFNGGNLDVNTTSTSGRYLFYLVDEGSTATINGGNFDFNKTQNQKRAYIYASEGTTVYVNGGTFGKASTRDGYTAGILGTGTVIITGGTFGFDPTTWVADGYKAVKSGEKWYVVANDVTVASTSNEVVTVFANGGTVLLSSDIELDARLDVAAGANVNLDMNGKTITVKSTSSVDPAFYTYKGSTLTITGNGTVEIEDPSVSLIFPGGDVVIENGTFVRNIPAGTPAKQVGAFFVGAKVSPWGSQTVTIKGGYFDGGYYDANAAEIDEILAGTKTLTETADDIAKRGNSKDANKVRVAIKDNVQLLLNLSYNLFKIYGGTFVGANPAWGDEGCMLPTTPNYLRPWSYYQGALLDGQVFNENGIVLPVGYTITKGALEDGRPTYTVTYNK